MMRAPRLRNPRLRDADGNEYDPETGRRRPAASRVVPMEPSRIRWAPSSEWERRLAEMEDKDDA